MTSMRSQSADPHGASRTAAPQRPSSTAAGSWGDGAGVAAAADGGLGVAPPQGLGAAALLLPATQPLQGLAQPQHVLHHPEERVVDRLEHLWHRVGAVGPPPHGLFSRREVHLQRKDRRLVRHVALRRA